MLKGRALVEAPANLPTKFKIITSRWNDKAKSKGEITITMAAIATISFFSSLIVSIVEKGNVKSGLKYIPIFMIGSLVLYFVFMEILGFVFSGILV